MPLYAMHALHYVAACDGCGARSPPLCTESLPTGRREAVTRLVSLGWSHAVPAGERAVSRAWVEAEGAGEWRCPSCGSVGRR